MTTKEEKARLKSIRTLMIECVGELDIILGDKEVIITPKVEKENPESITAAVEINGVEIPISPPKVAEVKGPMKIGDLNIGDEGIIVEAEILEIEKTEGTKDGKPWRLAMVMLSDKTGPIKLKLWNDQIEQLRDAQVNDIIRVNCWKVEKGYKGGVFELVYGQFGTINKVNIERHII